MSFSSHAELDRGNSQLAQKVKSKVTTQMLFLTTIIKCSFGLGEVIGVRCSNRLGKKVYPIVEAGKPVLSSELPLLMFYQETSDMSTMS